MDKIYMPEGTYIDDSRKLMGLGDTNIVIVNNEAFIVFKESHSILRVWKSATIIINEEIV
tara:strand:+ start:674 stop:853 length:180 start_codon:yes stop_codon:yes gene_type:complete